MRLLALLFAALALTACGSSSSSLEQAQEKADASEVAFNWSDASAELATYCLRQSADGSGDYLTADASVARMVNIARAHGAETYKIEGVTYRQALIDKASDLQDCNARLAAKIDRELALDP